MGHYNYSLTIGSKAKGIQFVYKQKQQNKKQKKHKVIIMQWSVFLLPKI